MSDMDNREKAFENKFVHEEELRFKIDSRRRKLLGLWVAEELGLSDEKSLEYAMSLVKYGIEDNTKGAVINKIVNDAKNLNKNLSESQVRLKNAEFEELAKRQITEKK